MHVSHPLNITLIHSYKHILTQSMIRPHVPDMVEPLLRLSRSLTSTFDLTQSSKKCNQFCKQISYQR